MGTGDGRGSLRGRVAEGEALAFSGPKAFKALISSSDWA